MTSAVPIEVELSGPLAAAVVERRDVENMLAARLDPELPEFGVPGSVSVDVRAGTSRRVLRVSVNGRTQPYPLGLLARSWQCVAPTDAQGVPYAEDGGDAAAADDRWIADVGRQFAIAGGSLATQFTVEAVAQVVMRRPQALLGDPQFEAYGAGVRQSKGGRVALDPTLRRVTQFLLGLGVSVARRDEVVESVRGLLEAGLPAQDIAEATFERFRARAIEVHCQPGYLVGIAGGDPIHEPTSVHAEQFPPERREAFERVERRLFDELGLRVPDIVWAPDATLRDSSVAIKINNRASSAVSAPRAGELHVDAPADVVRRAAEDVDGVPFFDAVRRRMLAVAPDAAFDRLSETGLGVSTPVEWIAEAVRLEVRARASDILGVEDVEYHMARLDERHPDLVAAVLGMFPLGDVTRILRALVREGHSIKDLLTIVERLLLYEEVTVKELSDLVFDWRFPVTEDLVDRPAWVRQFEFVRSGIAPFAVKRSGHPLDALGVIRIGRDLEERARDVAYQPPGRLRSWLDDDEQAELCDAVRAMIEQAVPSGVTPVVTTTRWARGGIREVLGSELPDLAVLTHEDLLPGKALTPLGTASIG
jgi:hypothetical protein